MQPRTLIIGNFLSGYGFTRGVCEELAPRLAAAGCTVITASSKRGRAARISDMLYTIWSRRSEYDVAQVDVYSGPAFSWAEAACYVLRKAGRPYILTLHGGGLPQFAHRNIRRVEKLLNSAAAVTVPSDYLLNGMKGYRIDLVLLPNALDVGVYKCRLIRTAEPRLIWLRAFHELYNPVMAVRVLARLKPDFPDMHLTMVGHDKGDGTLQQTVLEAGRCGAGANIEFRGPVDKKLVPELLLTGDIFLNTSNEDNTPVSVMEAMASGMCVVSTNAGGLPYLIEAEKEGLLVPVNNDAAMAAAIARILREPELAQKLQQAAFTRVRKADWSQILPQWQELLATAASRKPYPLRRVAA